MLKTVPFRGNAVDLTDPSHLRFMANLIALRVIDTPEYLVMSDYDKIAYHRGVHERVTAALQSAAEAELQISVGSN